MQDESIKKLADNFEDEDFNGNVVRVLERFFDFSPDEFVKQSFLTLAGSIDAFIKKNNRIKAIESLNNYPTDFYGPGWKKYFGDVENFSFHGEIKHNQIADILHNYKLLLNFDPNWEYGVHDRVFTALSSGTNVITNKNEFIKNITNNQSSIYEYKLNNPKINDLAELACNQFKEYEYQNDFLITHSWHARIYNLLYKII